MIHRRKVFILFVCCFFTCLSSVYAVTATYTYEEKKTYCYSKTDGEYKKTITGNVVNSSNIQINCSSGQYGTMTKKLDGKYAYCPQAKLAMPVVKSCKSVDSYGSPSSWTLTNALKAGKIISYIQAQKYSAAKEDVYIVNAMNTLFQFSGWSGIQRTSLVSPIQKAFDEADKVTYYTGSTLSSSLVNLSFQSSILQNVVVSNDSSKNYSTGVLNVAFGENKYPSNIVYTASCNNCEIYTDKEFKSKFSSFTLQPNEKKNTTLYIKTPPGLSSGTNVVVNFKFSTTVKYDIAKLWDCQSGRQRLITLDSVSYSPTGSRTVNAVIPDPAKKQIYFNKLDSSGAMLSGADVEVSLDNGGKCTTNGATGCNLEITSDVQSVNYTIKEIKAPSGYTISPDIKGSWTIGTNTSTCYKSSNIPDTDSSWIQTDLSDCSAKYEKKEVCIDSKTGNPVEGITDSENCISSPASGGGDTTSGGGDTTSGGGDTTSGGSDTTSGGGGDTPSTENTYSWSSACYNGNQFLGVQVDDKNVHTKCDYDYITVNVNGTQMYASMTDALNSVSFSKTDMDGKNVTGAKLKVCTETDYNKSKSQCIAYKTVTDTDSNSSGVSWYSGPSASTFNGFAIGNYYLVEESAAPGYILNTSAVGFSVDKDGNVSLLDNKVGELKENTVIIKNQTTKISISKQDMATTQEVPGAKLSICLTYKENENDKDYKMAVSDTGECVPASLADGGFATWTSTDKPHEVIGLSAGTYYLVEVLAPNGYATAESILFTLKEDGTLTDVNGNLLSNNKLVMHDKKIGDVKTGMLPFYIVIGITVVVVSLGIGSYYYLFNKKEKSSEKVLKIRKRKVHKNRIGN